MNIDVTISIHALLAESDITMGGAGTTTLRFLSTLSLRRATEASVRRARIWSYFYPRSPCGERHGAPRRAHVAAEISIHALLAESDVMEEDMILEEQLISIHALLAESDVLQS